MDEEEQQDQPQADLEDTHQVDEAERQDQHQGDHDEPQQAEPFIPPPQPPPSPLPPSHEQQQNDNPIPIAYERMQAWLHDQRQIARQQ